MTTPAELDYTSKRRELGRWRIFITCTRHFVSFVTIVVRHDNESAVADCQPLFPGWVWSPVCIKQQHFSRKFPCIVGFADSVSLFCAG